MILQKDIPVKFVKHNYLKDVFINNETQEVGVCPSQCPVFSYRTQSCINQNLPNDIANFPPCNSQVVNYIAHPYRSDIFFLCAHNRAHMLMCAENYCFNSETINCEPCNSDNKLDNFCTNCCYPNNIQSTNETELQRISV
ncbi:hypothetical protein [Rachiplusia nu nucleopolyhedrovirus]|uniref:Chitin-binding type-2 domain-containing protein n=1 Tax=Rachiplusia nu nucleopolyhedrovirus TaxID=2605775 RepID=A0AAE6IS90_9ABAC|nr:hypothetical protein QKQ55_gp128 [Rachiplusia nu nucleopolyhedrovirus]QEI03635.1 hypothetical protein [Rachiplusia nu nucleopolyhedrovirus]